MIRPLRWGSEYSVPYPMVCCISPCFPCLDTTGAQIEILMELLKETRIEACVTVRYTWTRVILSIPSSSSHPSLLLSLLLSLSPPCSSPILFLLFLLFLPYFLAPLLSSFSSPSPLLPLPLAPPPPPPPRSYPPSTTSARTQRAS